MAFNLSHITVRLAVIMVAVVTIPPLVSRPVVPGAHHIFPWRARPNRPALRQLHQTAPSTRSRRDRPCDECRKRKSKRVLQEPRRCLLCVSNKQTCTFLEKARPRKRKLANGSAGENLAKKSPPFIQTISTTTEDRILPPSSIDNQPFIPPSAPIRSSSAVDESLSFQRHRHSGFSARPLPSMRR